VREERDLIPPNRSLDLFHFVEFLRFGGKSEVACRPVGIRARGTKAD